MTQGVVLRSSVSAGGGDADDPRGSGEKQFFRPVAVMHMTQGVVTRGSLPPAAVMHMTQGVVLTSSISARGGDAHDPGGCVERKFFRRWR